MKWKEGDLLKKIKYLGVIGVLYIAGLILLFIDLAIACSFF